MRALFATLALIPLLAPFSPVLAEDPLDAGEDVAIRCQRSDGTHYGTAGICRKGREAVSCVLCARDLTLSREQIMAMAESVMGPGQPIRISYGCSGGICCRRADGTYYGTGGRCPILSHSPASTELPKSSSDPKETHSEVIDFSEAMDLRDSVILKKGEISPNEVMVLESLKHIVRRGFAARLRSPTPDYAPPSFKPLSSWLEGIQIY